MNPMAAGQYHYHHIVPVMGQMPAGQIGTGQGLAAPKNSVHTASVSRVSQIKDDDSIDSKGSKKSKRNQENSQSRD